MVYGVRNLEVMLESLSGGSRPEIQKEGIESYGAEFFS